MSYDAEKTIRRLLPEWDTPFTYAEQSSIYHNREVLGAINKQEWLQIRRILQKGIRGDGVDGRKRNRYFFIEDISAFVTAAKRRLGRLEAYKRATKRGQNLSNSIHGDEPKRLGQVMDEEEFESEIKKLKDKLRGNNQPEA